MATMAVGLGQTKARIRSLWVSHRGAGAQEFGPSFATFLGTLAGKCIGSEVARIKGGTMWDAGSTGNGVTILPQQ